MSGHGRWSTSRGGGSGGGRGGGGRRNNFTNPCLTMHQPWASLLVHGIKRIEGRSWPSPITGRLWIHAASKVPDPDTIKAMEDFYREIYAVNGIKDIQFPEHYPVSRLLGCVDVVGCLKCEELVSWDALLESVRLEGLTDYCWLCENPQKLLIPFEMRGNQGVYNMEKRIHDAAVRGLRGMQGPLPVKFPLPYCKEPLRVQPDSLSGSTNSSVAPSVSKTPEVNAAIAGARAAAMQFSRIVPSASMNQTYTSQVESVGCNSDDKSDGASASASVERSSYVGYERGVRRSPRLNGGAAPHRLFAAAFRELKFERAVDSAQPKIEHSKGKSLSHGDGAEPTVLSSSLTSSMSLLLLTLLFG